MPEESRRIPEWGAAGAEGVNLAPRATDQSKSAAGSEGPPVRREGWEEDSRDARGVDRRHWLASSAAEGG